MNFRRSKLVHWTISSISAHLAFRGWGPCILHRTKKLLPQTGATGYERCLLVLRFSHFSVRGLGRRTSFGSSARLSRVITRGRLQSRSNCRRLACTWTRAEALLRYMLTSSFYTHAERSWVTDIGPIANSSEIFFYRPGRRNRVEGKAITVMFRSRVLSLLASC